jgi:hypothetical protein
MSAGTFTIKRGDTSPAIRYALLPETVNLGAAAVQFQMRPFRGSETLIDAAAEIISNLPPVVQYNWQAGDTDAAALFQAEFRVTYSDGTVETFPNSDFILVNIVDDVPGLS